jgi:NAD(P)-dependent dehydrogenase (short-subunit alcohol dehydrogenase family)
MSVVLITGCSSGFGLETALAFARRGDDVIATVRDVGRANQLRAQTQGLENVVIERLDVTDQASIDHAVSATLARFGQIDVLVNNAGIGVIAALEVLDDATLRRVFDTNVFGATAMTRAVLPTMRQRHAGRVIFMNAIGGVLTTAFLGAYSASKHALDCLAAVFDLELRPFGIRVSSVYPSAFRTAIADNMPVLPGENSPYTEPTQAYHAALSGRIRFGPTDLSPVVDAVIEAATADNPRLRYLVAPHLAEILDPAFAALDALHQREIDQMTPAPGASGAEVSR